MAVENRKEKYAQNDLTGGVENYSNHFLYRAAMRHMQKGEWDPGLIEFVWLSQIYPLDQELRTLIQEMELRAKIDYEEQIEKRSQRKTRLRRIVSWSVVIALMAVILMVGGRAYSGWINDQVAMAQVRMDDELRTVDLALKYRDAQTLINSGEIEAGKELIEEIAVTNPDYPGLANLLIEADSSSDLGRIYNSANQAFENGNFSKARQIFQEINNLNPNYRDTQLKLEKIELLSLQEEQISKADEYVESSNWGKAIPIYEEILSMEPQLREDHVEEQLFNSYIFASESELARQNNLELSQDMVSTYYEAALVLRPQDRLVLAEQEKASTYLKARNYYFQDNWEEAIRLLNPLLEKDPWYAEETALQLVYEAHIKRGNRAILDGEPIIAQIDFEQAQEIALLIGSSDFRSIFAWLRSGDASRAAGEFSEAIDNYRKAFEILVPEMSLEYDLVAIGRTLNQADEAVVNGDIELVLTSLDEFNALFYSLRWGARHMVSDGEDVLLLASRFRSSILAIEQANGLDEMAELTIGDTLVIPSIPDGS